MSVRPESVKLRKVRGQGRQPGFKGGVKQIYIALDPGEMETLEFLMAISGRNGRKPSSAGAILKASAILACPAVGYALDMTNLRYAKNPERRWLDHLNEVLAEGQGLLARVMEDLRNSERAEQAKLDL